MTKEQIIRRLRYWRPRTLEQLLVRCRFPLQYVGGGAYRDVYRIVGTDYVVKIPIETKSENVKHAHNEYNAWRRITRNKKKYSSLVPYIPEIAYHNRGYGTTLMRHYTTLPINNETRKLERRVVKAVKNALGREWSDVQVSNIGVDADGGYVLTDLGHLLTGDD